MNTTQPESNYYYLITKYDADDYGLWITEDVTDESQGYSVRGSLKDIKQELDELLVP